MQAEIYIHIPFCVRKCLYCDFLSGAYSEDIRQQYVKALINEISNSKWAGQLTVPTIFIGGGTPSILPAKEIEAILDAIKSTFSVNIDAEITMECNPGTVDKEKLEELHRIGINRLSIGLQSANNDELKTLGRIHTYEEFVETYNNARAAGYNNINIDIMNALPGQTIDTYKDTLDKVITLSPEHISAYSLIIEEGTAFYEMYEEDELLRERGERPNILPSEDEERQMDILTEEYLHESGYERYEISNYSKAGYECKHNIGYWIRENYLGFGIGAASLVNEKRYKNQGNINKYIDEYLRMDGVIDKEDSYEELMNLSKQEAMEETMFLGLRLIKGVDIKAYTTRFHIDPRVQYKDILDELIKDELITISDTHIALTRRGRDISNYVMAKFIE